MSTTRRVDMSSTLSADNSGQKISSSSSDTSHNGEVHSTPTRRRRAGRLSNEGDIHSAPLRPRRRINNSSNNFDLPSTPTRRPRRRSRRVVEVGGDEDMPVMGQQSRRTLVIIDPASVVALTMRGPRMADGSRDTRQFTLDRNSTLREAMDYVIRDWDLQDNLCRFRMLDLNDVVEPCQQVFRATVVHDVVAADQLSFEIFISMDDLPAGGSALSRQRRMFEKDEDVGEPIGCYSPPDTTILLVFSLHVRGRAQLAIDDNETLAGIARIACEHFDQRIVESSWFENNYAVCDVELEPDCDTPNSLGMHTNQIIRMYDVDNGRWEFFWDSDSL